VLGKRGLRNDLRLVSSRRLVCVSRRKTPIIEEAQFNPTRGTPTRRPASAHRNCTSLRCKPSLNIAEAGGISGSLHAFECRQLVAGVVGDEWEEMPALSARREYLPKDGQIMGAGRITTHASRGRSTVVTS
jgi:hypothetical protein